MNYISQWEEKTINTDEFKIIFLSKNTFDLFWSEGWYNNARFKIDRKSKSFHLMKKPTRSYPKNTMEVLGSIIK